MSDELFRTLLNLWMVSDPWPLSETEKSIFDSEIENEAARRGYSSVPHAYHDEPDESLKAHGRFGVGA